MSMLTGPCPQCGKTLQIPEDLPEFSCLYCGARLCREDLVSDEAQTVFDTLLRELPPAILEQPNTISYLQPKQFPQRYGDYIAQFSSLLQSIDRLPARYHEDLAHGLVEQVQVKKPSQLEDIKYTLCLLFAPAVQEAAPRQGLPFCTALRQAWLEKHPKQVFQLITYEQIAEGFNRKKLCFITTAVCSYQGKADDCAELTAFRRFRDEWLCHQPGGRMLIDRYYAVAPSVVTAINATDPDTLYPRIWRDYLSPCYDAILRGDRNACKRRYTAMVKALCRQYHL